jgi:hypothetical protein
MNFLNSWGCIALNRFKKVFFNKVIEAPQSERDFETFLSDLDSWDILMISPSMLDKIPEKYVGLLIAIDCLHEFSNENRARIARVISTIAKFFTPRIGLTKLFRLMKFHYLQTI